MTLYMSEWLALWTPAKRSYRLWSYADTVSVAECEQVLQLVFTFTYCHDFSFFPFDAQILKSQLFPHFILSAIIALLFPTSPPRIVLGRRPAKVSRCYGWIEPCRSDPARKELYRWSVSLSVRKVSFFLIISSLLGGPPETPATFSSLRLRNPGARLSLGCIRAAIISSALQSTPLISPKRGLLRNETLGLGTATEGQ